MAIIPKDKYFNASTKLSPNTFNRIWDLINRNMGSGSANGLPVIDGENWVIYFDESGGVWGPDVFYLLIRDKTSYTDVPPGAPDPVTNIKIILENKNSDLFQKFDVECEGASMGSLVTESDEINISKPWGRTYLFKIKPTYVESPLSFEELRGQNLFTISVRLYLSDGVGGVTGRYSEAVFTGTTVNRPYVTGINPFTIIDPRSYIIPSTEGEIYVDYKIYWGDVLPVTRHWKLEYEDDTIDENDIGEDEGTLIITTSLSDYAGKILSLSFVLNGTYINTAYIWVSNYSLVVASLDAQPNEVNPNVYQPVFYHDGDVYPYTFVLTTKYSMLGDMDSTNRQFSLSLENSNFTLNDGMRFLDSIKNIIAVIYKSSGDVSVLDGYTLGDTIDDTDGIDYVDFYVQLAKDKDYSRSIDSGGRSYLGSSYNFKITITDSLESTSYEDTEIFVASMMYCKPILHLDFIPGGASLGSATSMLNAFYYDVPKYWGDVAAMGHDIGSLSTTAEISKYKLKLYKVNPLDSSIRALYWVGGTDWEELGTHPSPVEIEYVDVLPLRDYIPIRILSSSAGNLDIKGEFYAVDEADNEYLIGSYTTGVKIFGESSGGGSSSDTGFYTDNNILVIAGGAHGISETDTHPYPFYVEVLPPNLSEPLYFGDKTIITQPISDSSNVSVTYLDAYHNIFRIDGEGKYYISIVESSDGYILKASENISDSGILLFRVNVYNDIQNYRGIVYPFANIPIIYHTTFKKGLHANGIIDELISENNARIIKIAGNITNKSDFGNLGIGGNDNIVIGTGTYADSSESPEQKPVISGVADVGVGSDYLKLSTLSPLGFATVFLGNSSREIYPNIDILLNFYLDGNGEFSFTPPTGFVCSGGGLDFHSLNLSDIYPERNMVSYLNSDNAVALVIPLVDGLNQEMNDIVSPDLRLKNIDYMEKKCYAIWNTGGVLQVHHSMNYVYNDGRDSASVLIPVQVIIIGSTYSMAGGSSIGGGDVFD